MVSIRNILLATVASALVSAAPSASRSDEITVLDEAKAPINVEQLVDLDDRDHLPHTLGRLLDTKKVGAALDHLLHKFRREAMEARLIGGLQPIELPVTTYEYSLHASSTNKHIGSCHFATLLEANQGYADFSKATEYKCTKDSRKCRANGVGAKQAFIVACVESVGVYLPSGLN